MNTAPEFYRIADEIELSLMDFPPSASISLLAEVLSRTMARAEAMPDNRFLAVIQKRTIEILTEESNGVPH